MQEDVSVSGYRNPDFLEHVYSFGFTREQAEEIARLANLHCVTRGGKFVAGSFTVEEVPGQLVRIIGVLTGNTTPESNE